MGSFLQRRSVSDMSVRENNTLPHLHVHLFPRYKGDPFEEGPIDTKLIRESPFGEGEFESFRRTLQVRLSEG
jgi:diadenosine tetraphosphate (Ap4A) HIT family hydrolase